jgi:8-oxo-dGTP diphosphatase
MAIDSLTVPIGLKKSAVLIVLTSDRGYLLLHRTKEPHVGLYIPVGGRIEPFETPTRAAAREVLEETGLAPDNLRLAGIMTETSPTKFNWVNYVYVSHVDPVDCPDCDEGKLEWVAENELMAVPTPETDRYIYDLVRREQFFALSAEYDGGLQLTRLVDEITGRIFVE